MKMNKIVTAAGRMRRINARLVKVIGYKTGFDKKGRPTAVAKTYTPLEYIIGNKVVRSHDKKPYVSSIKFLDKKLNVKVSCSCPDFMYRWEVSLHLAGAADVIYSNGEMPDITNPSRVPGCCKHVIALRNLIKERHNV